MDDNCRSEITLASGRAIRMTAINQWAAYAGMLEGVPTKERNERIVARAVETAKSTFSWEPHLIRPTERPIKLGREYPFGIPSSLPGVVCIGLFDSFSVARDEQMDASALTIVWFQDQFAFPISAIALHAISTLDWNELASDYEY